MPNYSSQSSSPAVWQSFAAWRFARVLWERLNDGWLNISTMSTPFSTHLVDPRMYFRAHEKMVQTKHADPVGYQSPDYLELRRIITRLSPGEQDVVYDLGSGKGRVVCLFARRPVKRCIGVEFGRPLCDIAARNANSLRGKKARIDIVCEDAATADLNEGTIYFLYNPFGEQTLRDVLVNLQHSLEAAPRQVRLVYLHDRHAHVLAESGWLENYHTEWEHLGNPERRASFWRNSRFVSHVG